MNNNNHRNRMMEVEINEKLATALRAIAEARALSIAEGTRYLEASLDDAREVIIKAIRDNLSIDRE